MDKAEQLQTLIDFTAEQINELHLEHPDLSAIELFQTSVKNAVELLNQITMKPIQCNIVTIGQVDTTKLAYSLLDRDTVAVLRGDLEFAEMLDLDYLGGEEPHDD